MDVEVDVVENWNVVVVGCYEDYFDFGSMFNWKMFYCVILSDVFVFWVLVLIGFRVLLL